MLLGSFPQLCLSTPALRVETQYIMGWPLCNGSTPRLCLLSHGIRLTGHDPSPLQSSLSLDLAQSLQIDHSSIFLERLRSGRGGQPWKRAPSFHTFNANGTCSFARDGHRHHKITDVAQLPRSSVGATRLSSGDDGPSQPRQTAPGETPGPHRVGRAYPCAAPCLYPSWLDPWSCPCPGL